MLTENLSLGNIVLSFIICVVVVFFAARFLPRQNISEVRFVKLITYPFYLVGQIYVAGFMVIKILLKGLHVDIITVKTEIKAEMLRVILVDSITLTPGSILLDLNGDNVTLLWLRDIDTPLDPEVADKQLKHKLERRLIKAQRNDGDTP